VVSFLSTNLAARVRFPKSEIWRYVFSGFHQHPESLRMKFVRYGMKVSPGAVNSLGTSRTDWALPVPLGERARQEHVLPDPLCLGVSGTTVSQRCKTTYTPGEAASTAGKTGDPIRLVGIQRVKCRMKCFCETRSHGPQNQDFDGIRRIHISRFLTSGIEPEPRGS